MNNIENCIGSGVKITQVEFNIGLDGHMYTENGVATLLRQAGFKLYDDAYFVDKGEYLGNKEPVFVGLTSIIASVKEIKDKVKDLCDILQQDCIAILIDNYQGKLIYNKRHLKQVPKLKFDSDLFIDAYNKDNFNKNFK